MTELDLLLSIVKDAGSHSDFIIAGVLFIVALRKGWISVGGGKNCAPEECGVQDNCNKRFDGLETGVKNIGSDIGTIKQALYAIFNFVKAKDENLIVPDL